MRSYKIFKILPFVCFISTTALSAPTPSPSPASSSMSKAPTSGLTPSGDAISTEQDLISNIEQNPPKPSDFGPPPTAKPNPTLQAAAPPSLDMPADMPTATQPTLTQTVTVATPAPTPAQAASTVVSEPPRSSPSPEPKISLAPSPAPAPELKTPEKVVDVPKEQMGITPPEEVALPKLEKKTEAALPAPPTGNETNPTTAEQAIPVKKAESSLPETLPEKEPEEVAEKKVELAPSPAPEAPEVRTVSSPIASAPAESSAPAPVSRKKARTFVPYYDRDKPTAAFQMSGSLQALGSPLQSGGNSYSVSAVGFGFEWMPKALQGFGALSIGPSLYVYPVSPLGGVTTSVAAIMSMGGILRYQAHYWTGQPVVPYVGFEAQQYRYNVSGSGSQMTLGTGATFGAYVLLNELEPSAAHVAFTSWGIRRSYLYAEFKTLSTGDPVVTTIGKALFFGFRVEY